MRFVVVFIDIIANNCTLLFNAFLCFNKPCFFEIFGKINY